MPLPTTSHLSGNALTQARADVFIPELWSPEIKRELDANLIMTNYVDMVPDSMKKGDVIHIPNIGRLRTNAKQPETPVTLQAYAETEFTMEVKRTMEVSFMIEDLGVLQTDYNLLSEYTREAGYAMSLDIDNWILGYRPVLVKEGQVVQCQTAGGADAPLNRAGLLAAKLMMDKARVPANDRVWIFSPSQHVSLLQIDEFTSSDYVNGNPVESGMVGRLYGYPVILNNNIVQNTVDGLDLNAGRGTPDLVPTPGFASAGTYSPYWPDSTHNGDPNGAGQETVDQTHSLTANAYSGMLVRKEWLKFWMLQQPKSESQREATYIADVVVNHMKFDAKVYRPEFCVVIESFETV